MHSSTCSHTKVSAAGRSLSAYQTIFRTQCVSSSSFVDLVWRWGRLRCASCLSRFTSSFFTSWRGGGGGGCVETIWSQDRLPLTASSIFFFQDRLEKISFILVVIFFFSPSQIWDTMAVNAFWVHCSCYYWLGPWFISFVLMTDLRSSVSLTGAAERERRSVFNFPASSTIPAAAATFCTWGESGHPHI